MINVLLPVAGYAKRFIDAGYGTPKPLLLVNGMPMIKLAMRHFKSKSPMRLIFIVREDHCVSHDIANVLKNIFQDHETQVVTTSEVTKGTLCTCLLAESLIPPDEPLVIYTPDVTYESDYDVDQFVDEGYDGSLFTFKANSKDHSYVATDENGIATRTAEKNVISNDALIGIYCYKDGKTFLKYAHEAIDAAMTVNGEFYVAPMYNLLIRDGLRISTSRVKKMHVLGTPEDVAFYESHVVRYSNVRKFAVCSDHSGFKLKSALLATLVEMGYDVVDFGPYSNADVDHYDSLKPCVSYLKENPGTFGVAICQTGQGFNIAANKVQGIRSALIRDEFTAEMSRRHNAANFFCIPSASVKPETLKDMIKAIVSNTFDGGRHATRIRKISHDAMFIE